MIYTIRVQITKGPDLLGEGILHDIKNFLHIPNITKIKTTKIYRVEGIEKTQVKILADKLFCESINRSLS